MRRTAGLAPIVAALGGDLFEGGRRALVPGPGHSATDRSLSLILSGGRVVVHSFAGDDWRAALRDLQARGLIDGRSRILSGGGLGADPPPSRAVRRRIAERLWAEGATWAGTAAERHARRRGVTRALGAAVRFHPAVAAAVYADHGLRRPALLAAIREPAGALCGVEVTYLTAEGRQARVATPRKTIGWRPPGSAVRLDPDGPELVVGEGVFSCLSAAQALGRPAWALLSAGNLTTFRPPPPVRRLIIAADRGRVGETAAAELVRRVRGMGLEVAVRLPPDGAADWNDAVCGPGRGR